MNIRIQWFDSRREPQCPPDPRYPEGIDIDIGGGCLIALPYPAKRCGYYIVVCHDCHANAVITTAGRPDDPRSIRLPCRKRETDDHSHH